jgi:hypothetical protein
VSYAREFTPKQVKEKESPETSGGLRDKNRQQSGSQRETASAVLRGYLVET